MRLRRGWLAKPGVATRAVTAVLTLVTLAPLLAQLPRVAVEACFEVGHPLYNLVPSSDAGAHCVSAPTAAVSWTLMIAATLLVQLLLLPVLLVAAGVLLASARGLAGRVRRTLAGALGGLATVVFGNHRPVPVPVRSGRWGHLAARDNLRRGPPARGC